MSIESDRCYELLGVRPGYSVQELKSAYRDLAKVWHPDRFAHDPRLQQKAQEKLKEINDAYEQLTSGKTSRSTINPRASRAGERTGRPDFNKQANFYSPSVVIKSRSSIWLLVPVIVFSSVFIFTVRYLHNQRSPASQGVIEQDASAESANLEAPVETAADNTTPKRRADGPPDANSGELNAIATTTVVIDSATGLLARAECPTKVRMTYPTGHEPRVYCTSHPLTTTDGNHPLPKESRLKTLKRKNASSTEGVDESEKIQPDR